MIECVFTEMMKFYLSRKYVFYLVYILRKEFIRCESVKSQICRVCSDLTNLAAGWKWFVWQNINNCCISILAWLCLMVQMSGVNNVVSWNVYVQNIYKVACKIILWIKAASENSAFQSIYESESKWKIQNLRNGMMDGNGLRIDLMKPLLLLLVFRSWAVCLCMGSDDLAI